LIHVSAKLFPKETTTLNNTPPAYSFIAHTIEALHSGALVRLLLSAPVNKQQPVERIIGRLVEIKQRPMLSLTLREQRRDTTKNLPINEVSDWLAAQLTGEFRSAVLETTDGGWQFTISPKGKVKLSSHKSSATPPQKTHDRKKATLLDDSARPWLMALGLCDAAGSVRPSATDKFRQLERFLEILSHLVRECDWKPDQAIKIADMGCGKGYLTFGVWHLLNRIMGLRVEVVGVEARQELVDKTNNIARSIGAENLKFVAGDIASVELDGLDGLIALHACNTATDDAMSRGVRCGAKLIVVSPCCHQELRPVLGKPPLLAPLLAHGILEERFSEWLTDGLRALRLEQAGYATKMIEFVSSEHTPRNLLIAGVRKDRSTDVEHADEKISSLKEFFQLSAIASDKIARVE
jgi:SAM-dependent methyltransferase